ncbi:hypothetical protein K438DRAFT_1974567 [Mycena galopus ATCC 62051]|nr:hypothetical protein K438DRAFT_1990575 [Mycena galopus ATCC 62051]KAF8184367.1 hypothetical protein K438DRAFT_1974567 [Mycena galopus ATCC 62051]
MASDLTLTRRLFGNFRPHDELNLRHLAALRKVLEVVGEATVMEILQRRTGLRMVMGTGGTAYRLGTIYTSRVNGRLVTREYAVERAVRNQLAAYLAGYDFTYRKQGLTYLLLDPLSDHPRGALQEAEQAWHDWVVPYLAERGRVRPEWALEPLHGMQRVRVAPPRGLKRKRYAPPPPQPAPSGPGSSRLLAIRVPDDESDAAPRPRRRPVKNLPKRSSTARLVHLGTLDLTI